MNYTALMTSLCLLTIAAPVFAQEADSSSPEIGNETCIPAQGMKDAFVKFDGLKPERIDTVRAGLNLTVQTNNDFFLPERIEFRDGAEPIPVPLNVKTRTAELTPFLPTVSDEARLCIVHRDLSDEPVAFANYGMSLGLSVRFIETPGTHSLAEIEDGLKDGRAHFKKMAGVGGFMVPKFDHVAVSNHDPENPPRLWATKDGADIGEPESILVNGGRLISVEEVKDMGADGIRVEGDYRLSPSPDAKTVEKFMQ